MIDISSGDVMPPAENTLSRSAFLILLALADEPRHGLGIIENVEEVSQGKVKLGPGTLYGSLQRLAELGLIEATDAIPDPDDADPRRRYYRLTPQGSRALGTEAGLLQALVQAAEKKQVLPA